MIDNFELLKPFMTFMSDDDFYFANILQRKKEHPHLGNNSYVVKSYFIKTREELDRHKAEMVGIANLMNARVYINLNRRSFEKLAFHTLEKLAHTMMNKEYKNVKKAYTSVCGSFANEPNKRWILDCDFPYDEQTVLVMRSFINACKPISHSNNKVKAVIPTKHGFHLITEPFDLSELADFRKRFPEALPEFDIQKNNPTILYVP